MYMSCQTIGLKKKGQHVMACEIHGISDPNWIYFQYVVLQRWKNAVSTANFYSIRIWAFSCVMIQKGSIVQLKS